MNKIKINLGKSAFLCLFSKSEHSPLREALLPLRTHLFGSDWSEPAHLSAHFVAGSAHQLWLPLTQEWRPTAQKLENNLLKKKKKKKSNFRLTLASKMHKVVSICWMRRDIFASFCGEKCGYFRFSLYISSSLEKRMR